MDRSDPRAAALSILQRVEHEGAYSSMLLQSLDAGRLHPRDLALITELVLGVLRRARYLDHVLAAFSSRPVEAIDPRLRTTLRLGLYQLLFTRIPDHAAVDRTVELARRGRGGGRAAASFANGVLRAASRHPGRIPPPPRPAEGEDPAAALAVAESHPEWLVRRWIARFGPGEAALLLAAQNRPAPVAARVTGGAPRLTAAEASLASEGIRTRRSAWLDDVLVAPSGALHRTSAFRRGELYVQDEGSALVARLAGASPGDRVLDACAAPGGKSLAMAERVGEAGLVVSADLHPSRLRRLASNARRLRLACAPLAADLSADPPFSKETAFDVVLVDAPCSGTGIIRRDPELRDRLSQEALGRLAARQRELLDRASGLVRRGGVLVYSVCSLEPEEGELLAAAFLDGHPDFAAADAREALPSSAHGLTAPTPAGRALMTLPHRDDMDGFFAIRMSRQR
ncbi:MAG TPA: 16S rRNA (cytosine(967)-C(5))-methyltransferase RsmB [Candidatus Polarisedimenticolia bacterium]|nr:16S rRNA (cytosine(967)-C(5))-methyltransferase RsmB [Candidatus Polarisedimenticolia bacterium]